MSAVPAPLPGACPAERFAAALDPSLPVCAQRDEIIRAIREHQVVVVAGETGSGKTTQLPLLCQLALNDPDAVVAVTQPRRIAATSLASWTAQRLACPVGEWAGYRVRFDERCSAQTRILYQTDGMLLSDTPRDPALRRYRAIILDEAHERSLNIDFLMGYFRRLLPRRPDLRLIVSSATIDAALFSAAFAPAPVIEVSGRLFPVTIIYQSDEHEDDEGYVDRAVRAARTLVETGEEGDVLVFMPTVADIDETVTRLARLREPGLRVLPLHSRLGTAQQNRMFSPWSGRTIVVGTNIAETSLTVPRIRFVIDTGYARTLRYSPRTRITRMPVEAVSRASADQRAGRCGRVREGICIRLYPHEDFLQRDQFTTPELLRSNLAGVILQMAALRLGAIEQFPFVQPPASAACGDGRRQLRELGALDDNDELTPLGRRMARLPLDPCIARMVLQGEREGALREVKILAAGLSIADPRQRPAQRSPQVDQAHRRFSDPHSDFLLYLSLWNAFEGQWTKLKTQGAMRRFCREHVLSYSRMREWHDMYHQIDRLCSRGLNMTHNTSPATYEAIHRSLLSGLLTNVAHRQENGEYRATRGRTVHLFPGSALFRERHPWIVCHEIVETSRVWARTAARIDPAWIEQIAPRLCRRTWSEPWFDAQTGCVQAHERVTFFGLELGVQRTINYTHVNRTRAATLFITEGLVGETLRTHHRFFRHNHAVRCRIAAAEAKLRTRQLSIGDAALGEWYHSRLGDVASVHDLNRRIREQGERDLYLHPDDLLSAPLPPLLDQLPDQIAIGPHTLPLVWRFEPGEEHDGVTIRVPVATLRQLHRHAFEWVLPALWPQRVLSLVERLPRRSRSTLHPLKEQCAQLAASLKDCGTSFAEAVGTLLRTRHGLQLPPDWAQPFTPPPWVWPRVEISDHNGTLVEVCYPPALPSRSRTPAPAATGVFAHLCRSGLTCWDFGDLPERVEHRGGGQALFGYPALSPGAHGVDIVILADDKEKSGTHRRGIMRLLELALATELGWLERDLRLDRPRALACAPFAGIAAVEERLRELVLSHFLEPDYPLPRTHEQFTRLCNERRAGLRGVAQTALTSLSHMVDGWSRAHRELPRNGPLVRELAGELEHYRSALFEPGFTWERLLQSPRYLQGFFRRIALAQQDPARYRERMAQLSRCRTLLDSIAPPQRARYPLAATEHEALTLMLEEFALSLFAQGTVPTRYPVSARRFEKRFETYCCLRREAGLPPPSSSGNAGR